MTWTLAQIPDLNGRRAVVTGATGGIGLHTCLQLARAGAEVVLAARDEVRGHETADRIRAELPDARLEVLRVDLADLTSVRAACEFALNRWGRFDICINNAAVMAPPYRRTADGFELQLGTNHLGHFAWTGHLLPAITEARVVTVSSLMHHGVRRLRDTDPRSERRYRKWQAYSESKLANLLFMLELHRRARHAGLGLVSVGAHPGYASTNLQRSGPRLGGADAAAYLLGGVTRLVGQSASAGALPILMAATLPTIAGGTYLGPSRLLELRGPPQPVGVSKAARDPEAARRLWELSERVTGVHYL